MPPLQLPSTTNNWIAGVDGCKTGWFRVCREYDTGELRFDVMHDALAIVENPPYPHIVSIDVPIGLPDAGSRACDLQARACIGDRRSSVFPSPIRPAIAAASYEQASVITRSVDGRGVSQQAWAIFPKIKEVDDTIRQDLSLRDVFYEVHPEVSFWAWGEKTPIAHAKKQGEGRKERQRLIEAWLGVGVCEQARGSYLKNQLADDDILDAFAALWTAGRIYRSTAETLPRDPVADSCGLPMRITY